MVRATRAVGALIIAVGIAVVASGFYLFYSGEQFMSFLVIAAGSTLAYGGIALYLREPEGSTKR